MTPLIRSRSLGTAFTSVFLFFLTVFPASLTLAQQTGPVHLKVVLSDYPPFVMTDSTTVKGFDADLLQAVCDLKGWTWSWQKTTFSDMITTLAADSADLAIGAIYYTAERESNYFPYSAPYLETGLVLVTRNTLYPLSLEDIRGFKLGVKLNSTGEALAADLNRKRLNLTIQSFPSTDTIFQEVYAGRLDGLINDYFNSLYKNASGHQGQLVLHTGLNGTPFLKHFPLAFPMGKQFAASHKAEFDQALARLEANGTLPGLRKKWMVETPDIAPFKIWLPWLTYGFSFLFLIFLLIILIRKRTRLPESAGRIAVELEESREILKQAEERYHTLLQQSSDGILLADSRTRVILETNSHACQVLGYSEDELTGKTLDHLLVTGETSPNKPAEDLFSGEKSFRHKVGYPVFTDTRSSLIHHGGQDLLMVTFRDITERKTVENALRQNEESYRILFGQSPSGLMTTDKTGIITRVNPVLVKLLGQEDDRSLVGQPVSALPAGIQDPETVYKKTLLGMESQELETSIDLPAGKRLFKLRLVPLTGNGGEPLGSLTLAEDCTDLTQSVETLRQNEERFRNLVEGIPSPVIISRMSDSSILYVSRFAENVFGTPVETLIGRKTTDFYQDPDDKLEVMRQIRENGRITSFEMKVNIPGYGQVNLLASVSVITYNGEPCLLSIFIDITERKKSEKALRASEEKFRLLFDNAPLGIFHFDPSGLITACNQSFSDITGASRQDLIGKKHNEVPALKEFESVITKSLERYPVGYEGTYSFNPIVPFVKATFSPIILDDGGLVGGVGLIEDISQRKASEQALKESEERYRSIFQNMAEGIFQVDQAGRFLSVNEALIRMLGYDSAADLQKITYPDDFFMDPNDQIEVTQHALNPQLSKYIESYLRKKDGTSISANLNPRIVTDETGELKYFEVLVIDVSDLRQTENERRKLEQQLIQTQRLESLGTLAGGIAHDFNNVLSMILMAAESMKILSRENDKLLRYCDMVSTSAERGAAIAKQLLLFARSENIDLSPVDLGSVVSEVRDLLLHSFPKSIRIDTRIDVNNTLILGNSGQIQQVIMNLAINGRDAMTEKIGDSGEEGILTLALQEVSGWDLTDQFPDAGLDPYILLTIADTGTGIDDQTLQRIFEPFFTTKERGKGTGLGLSIVHGIIRGHQGFITVKSAPGQGTTFFVYFPRLHSSEQIQGQTENATGLREKGTILVVDDEELIRETLLEILKNAGYQVITADNGLDGLEKYKRNQEKINLVISDMGMPHMNGLEFFKNLKSLNPSVRLIFTTGYLEHGSKSELLQKGARDVIFKPFRVQDLLSTISTVMTERKDGTP